MKIDKKKSTVFAIIFIGLVINGAGQSILFSTLPSVFRDLGLPDLWIGIIVSCSAFTLVIFSTIWGKIIDYTSNKISYIVGLASFGFGTLIFVSVLDMLYLDMISTTTTIISLIVIRIIYAALTAGMHPSSLSYVTKNYSDKVKVNKISLISSAFTLGLCIGPSLVILSRFGNSLTPIYFISIVALFVSIIAYVGIPSQTSVIEKKEVVSHSQGNIKNTLHLLFIVIVMNALFSSTQQNIGFLVQELNGQTGLSSIENTGLLVSILAFSLLATQVFIVRTLSVSIESMIFIGFSMTLAFILVSIKSSSIYHMMLAMIFLGVGFGILIPSVQSKISSIYPSEKQGYIAGVIFSCASIGYIIGPIIGTAFNSKNIKSTYLIGLLILLLSAVFYAIGSMSKKRKVTI